jgi:glycosyltransferase involved in cell wall biosynthesis
MTGESKRPVRTILVGAMHPDISGSVLIMREIVRTIEADSRFESEVVDVSGVRRRGVLGAIRYLKFLVRILSRTARADLLFLFTIGSGLPWTLLPLWMIAAVTRTPLVVRCTGGTAHSHGGPFRQRLVRWLLGRARLYVVETELLRSHARSVGIDNVESIPNARDLGHAIRADHPYDRRWVMVSRLLPTKGVVEAVEAFRRLPDLSLDLVGPFQDGLDWDSLSAPENVRYVGSKPPEEIAGILPDYDGFVFPSYYPTEGHAGVVIEAMAAGLPVITTLHRSLPEVVDESCGILVPVRDVDALVQALSTLDEDGALRSRLAEGAFVRSRDFDLSVQRRRFTDLVHETVRGGKS